MSLNHQPPHNRMPKYIDLITQIVNLIKTEEINRIDSDELHNHLDEVIHIALKLEQSTNDYSTDDTKNTIRWLYQLCCRITELLIPIQQQKTNEIIDDLLSALQALQVELNKTYLRADMLKSKNDTHAYTLIQELEERIHRTLEIQSKREAEMFQSIETHSARIDELANQTAVRLDQIEQIKANAERQLKRSNERFENDIQEKLKSLGTTISVVTGQTLEEGYASKAISEKQTADFLRAISFILMILTFYLAYDLFKDLSPENITFPFILNKITLVILLTLPSAYLARESTKHRHKQFEYTQAGLDFSAVDPYLASLPKDEQHRLKCELSKQVFSRQSASNLGDETYPINSQELLIALINKLELPSNKSDKKD